MVTDRVGDFIIRLKNAAVIKHAVVSLPHSNELTAIALKLRDLGYLSSVETTGKEKRTLDVMIAYNEQGDAKLTDVKRISKPGRRMYVAHNEVHSVKNGFGSRIISTSKGILSDAEARKLRVGGENLFEIW